MQHTKPMGHYESSAKRKVHSTKCPFKETGESTYWSLNSTPENSGKKEKQTLPGGVEDWKESN